MFSAKGIEPDKSKIQAIIDMPSPRNVKYLQRFLGMVTCIGRFLNNLSEKTAIFRSVSKRDNIFQWSEEYEQAFQNLKSILSKTPCLEYFDTNRLTTISVDASQNGMGAVLSKTEDLVLMLQEH